MHLEPMGNISDKDISIPSCRTSLALHQDKLFALWVDSKHSWLCTASLDSNAQAWSKFHLWNSPGPVVGSPSFCDFGGKLYIVYAHKGGNLVQREFLYKANRLPLVSHLGAVSRGNTSLVVYEDRLFCVYQKLESNELWYTWFTEASGWAEHVSTGRSTSHDHSMTVINGELWLYFRCNDGRDICLGSKFGSFGKPWGPESAVVMRTSKLTGASVISMCPGSVTSESSTGFSCDTYNGMTVIAFSSRDSRLSFADDGAGVALRLYESSENPKVSFTPSLRPFDDMYICVWATANNPIQWAKVQMFPVGLRKLQNTGGWMDGLPDKRNVNQLTIPGTHDSHARLWNCDSFLSGVAPGVAARIVCQEKSITEQLELGVRYIDLRVTPKLRMCHGSATLRGSLFDVLDEINMFLTRLPRETVLVSINREQDGPTENIAMTVKGCWGQYGWYSESVWPTLGEVRGKAILLRRYEDPTGFGIDWDLWDRKTGGGKAPWEQQDKGISSGLSFFERWELGANHIRAVRDKPFDDGIMYFTTLADYDWYAGSIRDYSDYMKKEEHFPSTMNNLRFNPRSSRLGIICWDFIDNEVTGKIILMNYFDGTRAEDSTADLQEISLPEDLRRQAMTPNTAGFR